MSCSEENFGFTKLVLIRILEEKNERIRNKIFQSFYSIWKRCLESQRCQNIVILTHLFLDTKQKNSDHDLGIYFLRCLFKATGGRNALEVQGSVCGVRGVCACSVILSWAIPMWFLQESRAWKGLVSVFTSVCLHHPLSWPWYLCPHFLPVTTHCCSNGPDPHGVPCLGSSWARDISADRVN